MYCMLCYRCYVTYVSRGTSGRIVIEVEPELKKQVYAVLALSGDRKSTRLNSSHLVISYAVFCLKKKTAHPLRPSAARSGRVSGARSKRPRNLLNNRSSIPDVSLSRREPAMHGARRALRSSFERA